MRIMTDSVGLSASMEKLHHRFSLDFKTAITLTLNFFFSHQVQVGGNVEPFTDSQSIFNKVISFCKSLTKSEREREQKLAKREQEVARREEAVASREQRSADRVRAIAIREQEIDHRVESVTAREEYFVQREQELIDWERCLEIWEEELAEEARTMAFLVSLAEWE